MSELVREGNSEQKRDRGGGRGERGGVRFIIVVRKDLGQRVALLYTVDGVYSSYFLW